MRLTETDQETGPYILHKGVQKISKFVINGSILILKYAVIRLDKNKHFKKNISKSVLKNLGWAVKKWPKRNLLSFIFFWQELDKITCARGKLVGVEREKIEKNYKLKV